jgi:glycerol-3-phosphate acyltransferase PlsY
MPWIEQLQSANWREGSSIFFGAYILGCFATGYYLVHWRTGQDIRDLGSGNAGARNVGRALGWIGFLVTLIGDSAKGAFAVWAARRFAQDELMAAVAMLAVVAGHIWPAQLRFRGGKGVATSMGALCVYDYRLAAAFLLLFAIALVVLRKWVLPGMFAFAVLPFASVYFGHDPAQVMMVCMLSGLVLIAHRKNLLEEILRVIERPAAHAKHQHTKL